MSISERDICVGYAVDAWRLQRHANGVATYTATLVPAIRQAGARAYVTAIEVEATCSDKYVLCYSDWQEHYSALGRAMVKIGWRLAPRRVDLRLDAGALLRAIRQLHREAGLEVFEMEEAHGTAGLIAKSSPVPIVVRLHGPWLTTGLMVKGVTKRDFKDRVRREYRAIRLAPGVSAVSRDVLQRVRDYYELDLPDAVVIPNPIAPIPADRQWLPRGYDPDRILFVGRFDRHKGGDIAIRAFAEVLQHRPQARLVFVGPDRGCIDDHRRVWSLPEYVQHQLSAPWMRGRFEWLGLRSPGEIHELRRTCGVAIVPSRYESFSMVTLESMAAGCPVIAANVGGMAELVRHGRNGLLFRMGDSVDLADQILSLMSRPGMAQALGRQAAMDAAENYNPNTVARRSLSFYRDVMDRFHQHCHTRTWIMPQAIRL